MIYEKFLILFLLIYYFIIFLVGVGMKFLASRMYCKYVVNIINDAILKIRSMRIEDDLLEEELYNSYLKLEKLLEQENS